MCAETGGIGVFVQPADRLSRSDSVSGGLPRLDGSCDENADAWVLEEPNIDPLPGYRIGIILGDRAAGLSYASRGAFCTKR